MPARGTGMQRGCAPLSSQRLSVDVPDEFIDNSAQWLLVFR
jgi:hypothetical protein